MARKETFVIHVISRENATWQGQVIWLNQTETRSFRSMLELVKLMDMVLDAEECEFMEENLVRE